MGTWTINVGPRGAQWVKYLLCMDHDQGHEKAGRGGEHFTGSVLRRQRQPELSAQPASPMGKSHTVKGVFLSFFKG